MSIAIGFVAMIVAVYAACWLGFRYEAKFDQLLSSWWGLPTVLMGGPAALLGVGIAAGLLVEALA